MIQDFKGIVGMRGLTVTQDEGSITVPEYEGELANFESGESLPTILSKQKAINNDIEERVSEVEESFSVFANLLYPVGSILFNTSGANPNTYLSIGTWVAWGEGRVPVGVDTSQTEFYTVEETGGEKTHTLTVAEMPEHNHDPIYALSEGEDYLKMELNSSPGTSYTVLSTEQISSGSIRLLLTVGEGAAHNNLQPYITCYMWKRTK